MTYREAIAYVRLLLDESGIEAYTDDDILGCIGEAQVAKAREYYQRGEKEAIRPLYREDVIGLSSGNTALSETPMNIEVVLLKLQAAEVDFRAEAVYVPLEEYLRYQYPNPSVNTTISGRCEYTYKNDEVYHNGLSALVCYYKLPLATGLAQEIELAEYCHPQIVDYAAYSILKSEVPDTDHSIVGGLYDIESILKENVARGKQ